MCERCTCRPAVQGPAWHHRTQCPDSWAVQGVKAYTKTRNHVITAFLCHLLMLMLYANFQPCHQRGGEAPSQKSSRAHKDEAQLGESMRYATGTHGAARVGIGQFSTGRSGACSLASVCERWVRGTCS